MTDFPKVLYQFEGRAGKPFRPGNDTEGLMFDDAFCSECIADVQGRIVGDGGCWILGRALGLNICDEGYPTEWQFSDEGWPVCTKFDPVLPDDKGLGKLRGFR